MTDPAITDPPKVEDPPAVDPPKVDPPADPPKDPNDPINWDPERAKRTIEAQRAAEEQLKADLKEAKKAQTKLQEIEDAKKDELERTSEERDRLKAENDTAQQALRDARLQVALTRPELGVVDPETAATLLKERGLTFAADGSPEGLTEAVTALLEDKPFLKGAEPQKKDPPPTDAGAGQGGGPGPPLNADQMKAAQDAGMDPAEYALIQKAIEEDGSVSAERWQQIQTQLAAAKT